MYGIALTFVAWMTALGITWGVHFAVLSFCVPLLLWFWTIIDLNR